MLTGPPLSRFRSKLLSWFAQSQRDLPWRRTKDPYCIWLSEIMLQQTRVAAVIPYYERFLEHFPNVRALADAPEAGVLRQWAGLGYYSRARNLQRAAQKIVKEHGSRFPKDVEKALELPGIGPYTAPAILSIAYGKKLAVLDGNVARVLARLGAVRGDLRSGKQWQKLQRTADTLLAPGAPGDWNQAMMELGATVCTPRSPQCLLCPIADFCQARKLGLSEIIPAKRIKRANVEITLAALVLADPQGRTLLLPPPEADAEQESSTDVLGLLSRMWHFPTVFVKANAEAELRAFAAQNIFGKCPVRGKLQPLQRVRHAVTYRQITLQPFRLDIAKLPAVPHSRVLPLDNLGSVPISNLTRKVASAALLDRPGITPERAQNEMLSF
jgi:A/G-specific adenine glycosylase